MARVTQRVDPGELDALLERPPRAAIACSIGGRVETWPVAYRRAGGRHLVGLDDARAGASLAGERAVLVIDAGRFWFELRAVTLRGTLARADEPPPETPRAGAWLELVVEKTVAWNYEMLHEVADP